MESPPKKQIGDDAFYRSPCLFNVEHNLKHHNFLSTYNLYDSAVSSFSSSWSSSLSTLYLKSYIWSCYPVSILYFNHITLKSFTSNTLILLIPRLGKPEAINLKPNCHDPNMYILIVSLKRSIWYDFGTFWIYTYTCAYIYTRMQTNMHTYTSWDCGCLQNMTILSTLFQKK